MYDLNHFVKNTHFHWTLRYKGNWNLINLVSVHFNSFAYFLRNKFIFFPLTFRLVFISLNHLINVFNSFRNNLDIYFSLYCSKTNRANYKTSVLTMNLLIWLLPYQTFLGVKVLFHGQSGSSIESSFQWSDWDLSRSISVLLWFKVIMNL